MMFSGIWLKQKASVRNVAIAAISVLLLVNILEMCGTHFFNIDLRGMLRFDRFALLFNSIIFFSVLIYFLLSAKNDFRFWIFDFLNPRHPNQNRHPFCRKVYGIF